MVRGFTEPGDGSNLTATGLAQFSDVDLTDRHNVSVILQSSMLLGPGTLPPGLQAILETAMTASILSETGDGHGQAQWNFALDGHAVQFLAFGQRKETGKGSRCGRLGEKPCGKGYRLHCISNGFFFYSHYKSARGVYCSESAPSISWQTHIDAVGKSFCACQ